MKEAVSSVTKAVILLSDNKREGNYFRRASDPLAVMPTKLCYYPVFVDEPSFTTKQQDDLWILSPVTSKLEMISSQEIQEGLWNACVSGRSAPGREGLTALTASA